MENQKLFENSQASVRSNLLLSENSNLDVSVLSTDLVPLYSLFSTTEENTPIIHQYLGSSGHFVDLANSFLYIVGYISQKDGTDLPADAKVALSPLCAHGQFSGMETYINGTLVSNTTTGYPQIANMTRKCTTSYDMSRTLQDTEYIYDTQ